MHQGLVLVTTGLACRQHEARVAGVRCLCVCTGCGKTWSVGPQAAQPSNLLCSRQWDS